MGRIWPMGRSLPTPGIYESTGLPVTYRAHHLMYPVTVRLWLSDSALSTSWQRFQKQSSVPTGTSRALSCLPLSSHCAFLWAPAQDGEHVYYQVPQGRSLQ